MPTLILIQLKISLIENHCTIIMKGSAELGELGGQGTPDVYRFNKVGL